MKRAFVLSGGSIRGAFQAGAIAEVLTSGSFAPEAIYGTSVGSLNGAFLADRAGRAVTVGTQPNWVDIGNELQNFWLKEITNFEKLGDRRYKLKLFWDVITNNFNGFVDNSALEVLIKKEIKVENLRRSPVKFFACSVNVITGELFYASVETHENNIFDYIIASTAIPMVMPVRIIGGQPYVDGGLREVAPLNKAIDAEADDIVCIVCQPLNFPRQTIDHKNVITLMDRLMSIATDEIVNNDIEICQNINELLDQVPQPITSGPLKGKRKINLKIIRPEEPVDIELENFDSNKILAALKAGWAASQKARRNWT